MSTIRKSPSGAQIDVAQVFSGSLVDVVAGPPVNVLVLPQIPENEAWTIDLSYWGRINGSLGPVALTRQVLVARPAGSIPLFSGQEDITDSWPGGVWLTNPSSPGSSVIVAQFVPVAPLYDFVSASASIVKTPIIT